MGTILDRIHHMREESKVQMYRFREESKIQMDRFREEGISRIKKVKKMKKDMKIPHIRGHLNMKMSFGKKPEKEPRRPYSYITGPDGVRKAKLSSRMQFRKKQARSTPGSSFDRWFNGKYFSIPPSSSDKPMLSEQSPSFSTTFSEPPPKPSFVSLNGHYPSDYCLHRLSTVSSLETIM